MTNFIKLAICNMPKVLTSHSKPQVLYNSYRFQTSMIVVDFKFSISEIHIDFRPHKKEIYNYSRFQTSRTVVDFRHLG